MRIQRPFFLFWMISGLWLVHGLRNISACAQLVCVNGAYDAGTMTYEIQVKDSVGWMGLGLGQTMVNTDMVIVWNNEDGTTTLSQRYSKGFTEPKLIESPPWKAALVQPTATNIAGSTTFAFRLLINETVFDHKFAAHSIIWAYSHHRPSSSDPSSALQYHDARGMLVLKFETHPNNNPPPSNNRPSAPLNRYERVIVLHGLLVSFGFFVLLPTGVIVARYARTFTTKWFKLHQLCNSFVGFPVITIGTVLGPTAIFLNGGVHFADTHQICGIFVLAMFYMQLWLGRYIHQRRSTKLSIHPISNIVHVALGLIVIGAAIFQVKGGLHEWDAKIGRPISKMLLVPWKRTSVILLLLYLGGLFLLPRQFRQEKDTEKKPDQQYMALSAGPFASETSEMVFNAEEEGLVEQT